MADITLKRKEAKTITITITDENGAAVDVSSAVLKFVIKDNIDGTILITKNDADFNKTQANVGIVSFIMTATDTDRVGLFFGELQSTFSATDIDKSENIKIHIEKALNE